jgi:cytochrome c1
MKRSFLILAAGCLALPALASEAKLGAVEVSGDIPTLERGMDAMMSACHSCHSLKYLRYRDLLTAGMDPQKVTTWRGDQPLDTPLLAQMSENDAVQSFGKAPPDLSLMAKARDGGARYVYAYLIGYYQTPEGLPGNHVYPETKMPDPLGITGVTDTAQLQEIQGKARDIVSFLVWASDPHAAERNRLGYYVIAYLIGLTILLFFVKKRIWARLDQ